MSNTLKVLIADDELLFRNYLSRVLMSENLDIQICAKARNGSEALKYAKLFHPDIVLTDINMPYVNGLELVEKLKLINNEIIVILVTGFGEFEYARKAVKLGVSDFLLKPFTRNELLQCMNRAKSILAQRRNKESVEEYNRDLARVSCLRQIVDGEMELSLFADVPIYSEYKIKIDSEESIVAIAIKIEDHLNYWNQKQDKNALYFAVQNILCEKLSEKWMPEIFYYGNSKIAILLNCTAQQYDDLLHCIERVCELCWIHIRCKVMPAVSELLFDYQKIPQMWQALQKNLKQQNVCLQPVSIDDEINHFEITLTQTEDHKPSKALALFIRAVEYMKKSYMNENLTIETIADAVYISPSYLRKVFKSESNRTVMDVLLEIRMNRAKKLISEKSMRLSDVAQKVGYSDPAYFSRCFKKYFGMTPSEYEIMND